MIRKLQENGWEVLAEPEDEPDAGSSAGEVWDDEFTSLLADQVRYGILKAMGKLEHSRAVEAQSPASEPRKPKRPRPRAE